MKRLIKWSILLACLCMVFGAIAPAYAEEEDDSDTILWLDDMTAYGFTEDVNGFGDPSYQYLSESVILEYYDWLEPGNHIDIMGDGLSFGLNGYPTYEGEKESLLADLPYTTVYDWDTYNATREEPLTVKTMTIKGVEFHYVSGQMTTRKIYVGRGAYEDAVEVYFFHAYAFVGGWDFSIKGAAVLEHYRSAEALAEELLSTVHFRDAEGAPNIGEIAADFIPETFTFHYYSDGQKSAEASYSDSYFDVSGYQYQSDMAATSMAMALSAYNYKDVLKTINKWYDSGYKNVEEMMGKMGFTNLAHNGAYEIKPEAPHTAGVALGSKKIGDSTVIAIAVRGGNYGKEWAGNFTVGESDLVDHDGFGRGRDIVIEVLKQYISRCNITGKVKFWLTGYSRASAIANLSAAALDRGISFPNVTYTPDDVYAYCFEVPANTTDSDVGNHLYANIFNIINPIDPVPRVAPAQWGFSRYGYNVYIPAMGVDASYNHYIDRVKASFESMTEDVSDLQFIDQMEILNRLVSLLTEYIPDREEYVKNYQDGIVDIILSEGIDLSDKEQSSMIGFALGRFGHYAFTDEAILDKLEGVDLTLEDGTEHISWAILLDHLFTNALSDTPFGPQLEENSVEEEVQKALDGLLFSHYAEWTYSWMKALEGTGVLEKTQEANGHSDNSQYATLMVKFNCPVTVSAYDSAGNHLGTLNVDGTAQVSDDSILLAYIDGTGAKVFFVPQNTEVTFDIQAVDDGTMTVNIQSVEVSTSQTVRYDCYDDLELVKGESYHMSLNSGTLGSDYEAEMYTASGDRIDADYVLSGDSLIEYSVSATCDENGYVSPEQSAPVGSYVRLHAYPKEEYVLKGWYDADGKCVGKDSTLIVKATEDRVYEARFVKERAIEIEPLPVVGGIGAMVFAIAILLNGKKKREKAMRS